MPRKAKRNAFGSIKARNNAHGVVYQARYKTPIEMFSKYDEPTRPTDLHLLP